MTDLGTAARLRAAFELSPTILAVSGLDDGRLLEVNDAFLRITGWTREEIIGRPIPEIGFWVDDGVRREALEALRAGETVRDLECRFRTKAGDECVVLANADLITVDGQPCVITALMDITARVRAEQALRESERRFAQFFNANPLPMTIVRMRDGVHLDVNEAMLRHTGYTRADVLGRTTVELRLWALPEERQRLVDVLEREGRVRDFEMKFRNKAGVERHMLVNCEVIAHGGEPAVLNVAIDITERKDLEAYQKARREEAETLTRAKDEFLAMLGHELRNPLGTITNSLAVLNHRVADDALRRVTDIIGRQTAHLTRLVDDLLDVARVTSGKVDLRLAVHDLRELAGRCVDALGEAGRTAGHRVAVEGESVSVLVDPARIEQVIANLLDNALKYTPAGGEVRVVTAREGNRAVLSVRDTGEGIRPELLARVFELFVQQPQALDRARGGLGLGLTLVKQLVSLHGGSVEARSAGVGHGSEFIVRLPATAEVDAPSQLAPSAAATLPPRCRRVLIVEDHEDARESLRLMLELAGHEVETAGDGPSGLATLLSSRPDIALIDVGLPGIDGYDVVRRARSFVRETCLVALTGYGQADDQRKAREAGFDVHITKPVDPDRLERLLRTLTKVG
jgi:PAS domain S-box-containing protein